uniref:Uncharacterized protein n=1 Tax=Anguilla anguilla TaxID=7936 RepID=A0A0E9XX40_ANGAN
MVTDRSRMRFTLSQLLVQGHRQKHLQKLQQ